MCGAVLGCALVLALAAAHPHPHPQGAYDCPYPQGGDYEDDDDYNGGDLGGGGGGLGLRMGGDSGYAQGPNAFSSYSGYGGGNIGGYGGGHADPSGRSASSFGVGYGR